MVERASALATLRPDRGFILPAPVLLVGPPGIGKTDFCQYFTGSQLHMELIDGGTLTAGFEITGASPVWRGGKAGRVYEALKAGSRNPLIVIDELDKITENTVSPVYGAIGGLLEQSTAARFRDEFTGEMIDASHINWVFTANELNSIPAHIIDRCEIIHCDAPSATQLRIVIKSIWEAVATKLHASNLTLSSSAIDGLIKGTGSFRLLKRALTNAVATCVMKQNDEIQFSDVEPFLQQTVAHKIGF